MNLHHLYGLSTLLLNPQLLLLIRKSWNLEFKNIGIFLFLTKALLSFLLPAL